MMILEKALWTTLYLSIIYFNYEINRKITAKIYREKEMFVKNWNEIKVSNIKVKSL